MEFTGAAFSIAPLINTCTKIVRILRDVGKKFKRAPLMMTSIATECSLIHVALDQLRTFDWSSLAAQGDNRLEQMTRLTETIILGCTLTLSVIEEYASELQEYVEGSKLSPTEQMGIMARVRVLWKEDEMRELLLQLRGYQTGLTNLLRAAHDEDQDDVTIVQSNLVSLLHRSRTSRSRKPLSVRSAMQQSVAYTGLSRSSSTAHASNGHQFQSRPPGGYHHSQSSLSKQQDMIHGVSPMTADLYDRATSATASREPISDKGRRKRPAFLALHAEDLDNQSELARYQQSRKEREHLRKSSPTVGENFTFLEAGSDILERPLREQSGRASRQPTLQNGTMSSARGPLRSNGRPSPEEEEEEEEDEDEDEGEDGEEALEQHLEDPPVPPPANVEHLGISQAAADRLSSITEESPQPKKQKSSSSVRSQIIALPETARLRKQASGEQVRQGSPTTATPSLPKAKAMQNPTRMPSHEILARRRQSDFTHRHQTSDPTTLAFRARRTSSRSASQDARPHPTIPLPPPPSDNEYGRATSPTFTSRPMSPASISTTILSPASVAGQGDESWPLTPDTSLYPQSGVHHSRTTSEDPSFPALRSLSPDSITPRPSRSGTPLFSNTPYSVTPRRGRSHSNTAMGSHDEHSYEQFNDAASVAASSVAPSTMSAQWYRTPRERLGLGGRISARVDAPPWEQGETGDDEPLQYEEGQAQQRSRKVQLFTIYPPKAPTANNSGSGPEMHPRSPLLTDKFLTDVHGLPDDLSPQRQQALPHLLVGPYGSHDMSQGAVVRGEAPLHQEGVIQQQHPAHQAVEELRGLPQSQQSLQNAIPQRTLSLRSLTPRRSGSRAGTRPENGSQNNLNKQPSQRSMIGTIAKEYKNMADTWYTGQYEDEEAEVDEQIRRMREEDAAYENERYGSSSHIIRPSTSAGIFPPHETANRIVKEVTVHQHLSPIQKQPNGQSQSFVGGMLRNRPSGDTDSTTTTTTTSGSIYTTVPVTAAGASKSSSSKPPGTSNSSKSGSSGKSKKDKKDKKDKKKKKPSFWNALREESKALSTTWYQEAHMAHEEAERSASRRAGSA